MGLQWDQNHMGGGGGGGGRGRECNRSTGWIKITCDLGLGGGGSCVGVDSEKLKKSFTLSPSGLSREKTEKWKHESFHPKYSPSTLFPSIHIPLLSKQTFH